MDDALELAVELNTTPRTAEERAALLAEPGFGRVFTDHMATATWTADGGWRDPTIRPYGPLSFDPATSFLHYGQAIFEGFKAYRHPDGSVVTFRPERNGARFRRSAARLALPELPVEWFVGLADELIRTDREWVPTGGEASLYLRPLMLGTEVQLGVKPSSEALFLIVASPAGSYFAGGVKPVTIWLSEEYVRASPGGTGAAKCAGNYAASLLPQQEAIANGCDQVAFVDAVEHRWVEELGGMNLFFVHDDGSIVTPELTGTILEGVTRDAILTLAGELGHKVEERRVDIAEWRDGVATGRVAEVFACGTAAVVTPVGRLKWRGGEVATGDGGTGPVTQKIRDTLLDLQLGRAEDTHGWLHRVC
ncbi:MAG TPA: branched-chain amino acid aminotransferase [Mycobacteriales bacterium]|jgi:branched-chain amino acid aminotransferase|nr:branched-chain amino acid aminotransferase [Mycobacteriales bacterium]